MQKVLISMACGASIFIGACSTARIPWVHRIDVQQGNVIEQTEIDQLKPGMTKRQVNYVLGTPMLIDVFHADRWDYVYRMQPGSGEVAQKRVSLFFADDKLARIEGDLHPNPQLADAQPPRREQTVTVPPLPPKKGFFGRMWDTLRDKNPYETPVYE